MPFASDFWTTSWVNIKFPHLFPNASISNAYNNSWNLITLESFTTCYCIQGPVNAHDGDDLTSLNVGKFIGKKTDDSTIIVNVNVVDPFARGAITSDPSLITVKTTSDQTDEQGLTSYYPLFHQLSSRCVTVQH